MKTKSLVAVVIAAFISVTAFADSRIVKGDASMLRDDDITCSVEYDFSKTIVEGTPYLDYLQQRGDKYISEWNDIVVPNGLESFAESWNKACKHGLQVSEKASSEYKMVIAPSSLYLGDAALSAIVGFGAGGCKMSGTITIYHGEDVVMEITVSDQTGKSYAKANKRLVSLMSYLAKDTLKDVLK